MLTFTYKISDNDIKDTIEDLEGSFGIRLTKRKLESIVKKNPVLLNRFMYSEEFIDAIVEYVGMYDSWPTYADTNKSKKKANKFFKEFKAKAAKKGIKTTEEFGLD